jgi:putative endonuclease
MSHNYYIYILTNKSNRTLYVGVTRNIPNCLEKHKKNFTGFAYRYDCNKLVYYEHFTHILDAIAREKQIKNGDGLRKTTS